MKLKYAYIWVQNHSKPSTFTFSFFIFYSKLLNFTIFTIFHFFYLFDCNVDTIFNYNGYTNDFIILLSVKLQILFFITFTVILEVNRLKGIQSGNIGHAQSVFISFSEFWRQITHTYFYFFKNTNLLSIFINLWLIFMIFDFFNFENFLCYSFVTTYWQLLVDWSTFFIQLLSIFFRILIFRMIFFVV